jgi:hypothetical protein
MMERSILFALLPAMLVAACTGDYGPVYSVKMDRAQQILSKTDLPPVFGSNAVNSVVQAFKPGEVTWIVMQNGNEIMRYVATLKDAGEGKTRVGLVLKGAKTGPAGDVDKRLSDNLTAKNLYLSAMEERIASSLQARPMDMSKIYPALGFAIAANMGTIRKPIDASIDEAVKASEQMERNRPRPPLKRLGD